MADSSIYKTRILNIAESKIKSGDILGINVSTLSPESNILFNSGVNNNPIRPIDPTQPTPTSSQTPIGYEVDRAGNINFPVIGKIKLIDLTKEEASDKLYNALNGYVKNPIVNVRFLNFRVTIIGEVNKPATFNIQNDQVSVLEALGLAGDLTLYGRRENVLLIRQTGNDRTMVRLDLNNKDILNSPYFYLQQNDVLYVEPDKSKLQLTNNTRTTSIIVASATIIGILLSRLLFN
ncbi:polysaccharide biosynthesis/export family protein [Mucilaginibacter agri]|uniref:polysaccharide biosynthesis/export family protein n=1 Tax=Mucilaginibacter agri TaxID=2695265 RepID=UPI001FB59961|nr:polysaccharide biosynthesis/export family protein [Mucilaginibacter agri]